MARVCVIFLLAVSLKAAVVSGTVYSGGQSRRPVAGVKILARATDGVEVLRSADTDADGRYVLSNLPKGALIVSPVKRGYVLSPQSVARQLELGAADNVTGLDFDLLPGAQVTGRVTDSLGEPLEGVRVEFRRPGAGPTKAPPLLATTDDTGNYRMFGLDPGRYVVLGQRGTPNPVTVYFPGRSDEQYAQAIEAAAGNETSGIDLRFPAEATSRGEPTATNLRPPGGTISPDNPPAAAPLAVPVPRSGEGPRGSVSGVIVSGQTGEPLAGATITLSRMVQGGLSAQSVRAGPDGAFLFPQLEAGAFGISASKAGYRARSLANRILVSENQARTGLEVKLDREPSISGRVEDGNRQPVIGARVTAYALRWVKNRRIAMHGPATSTDDRGQYRLAKLPPGRYVVGAAVVSPSSEQATGDLDFGTGTFFYPSGERAGEGIPLEVRYGQQLTEINVRATPRQSFSVSGLVADAETRGPCASCTVHAFSLEESYAFSQTRSKVASDGSYRVRGLTPGSYRVVVEKRVGKRTLIASRTIEVEKRDLTDVHLVAGVMREQAGRVILESPPAVEAADAKDQPKIGMEVIIGPSDGIGTAVSARVGSDGTFRAINPPCEACMVQLEGLPEGGHLRAIRVQDRELPAPEIEVPGDLALPPIELVVSFKSAALSGQVTRVATPSGERAPVEAVLVLVPAANESSYLVPQAAGVRPDGGFQMTGIPPGGYTAFAIPRSTKLDWGSPEVRKQMESFGKSVSLAADKAQTIELPLAPEDQP